MRGSGSSMIDSRSFKFRLPLWIRRIVAGVVVHEGVIVGFFPLDLTDNDNLFERAMDIIAAQMSSGFKFDACCTYYEDAVTLSVRISAAMVLESNPVEACEKARNKALTRETLTAAGFPSPKFRAISGVEDL